MARQSCVRTSGRAGPLSWPIMAIAVSFRASADDATPQLWREVTADETYNRRRRPTRDIRHAPHVGLFSRLPSLLERFANKALAFERSPRAPMLHLMNAAVAQVDLSSGLSSGSSASSFDRLVLHGDKTLLVMFGAPWCSHCKTLAVSCSPLLPVTLLARLTAFVSCIMVYAHAR